ncbi:MAG TPA: NAD(P)/FAD-dependent oxidoreductase [Terriglobales bacterium]|nr:NAD(P)/FAD-dependent oxidoreductase [Terriglobales bacterium]
MTGIAVETDVFVVGGGPSGLAVAVAARHRGFSVTVADIARPPIDKACGEGIMPDGLAALRNLGVNIPLNAAAPFQGIRFLDDESAVQASFAQGPGLGLRRTKLHEILIDKAAEAGVNMHWGAHVTGLTPNGIAINGVNVRCRWVVGADGQNSRVRCWSGLESVRSSPSTRFGFRRHYRVVPWSDFVEVYWTKHGQLYVTPVGEEEVCVAFINRNPKLRLEDAFAVFPQLYARLKGADLITRQQGAVSATRALRSVYRGSTVLVGEASGSVDAITGDGLSMAFQQAHALAEAFVNDDLAQYQRAHRRIERLPRMMANLMLLMDRSRWLRARSLRSLAASPNLFTRMLAVHTGELPLFRIGIEETLSFGWHVLRA